MSNIGKKLRLARHAADLTLEEASKNSGVPRNRIHFVETGRSTYLTIEQAKALGDTYRMDPAEILDLKVPPDTEFIRRIHFYAKNLSEADRNEIVEYTKFKYLQHLASKE